MPSSLCRHNREGGRRGYPVNAKGFAGEDRAVLAYILIMPAPASKPLKLEERFRRVARLLHPAYCTEETWRAWGGQFISLLFPGSVWERAGWRGRLCGAVAAGFWKGRVIGMFRFQTVFGERRVKV